MTSLTMKCPNCSKEGNVPPRRVAFSCIECGYASDPSPSPINPILGLFGISLLLILNALFLSRPLYVKVPMILITVIVVGYTLYRAPLKPWSKNVDR